MGIAVLQSELARHATHACEATWQCGVVPLQSESASHCTHSCVVGSQILAFVGQFIAVRHPTHAPVTVSQSWPRPHAAPPSAAHAAWQVWLPG